MLVYQVNKLMSLVKRITGVWLSCDGCWGTNYILDNGYLTLFSIGLPSKPNKPTESSSNNSSKEALSSFVASDLVSLCFDLHRSHLGN